MYRDCRIAALLLMAGKGERFGNPVPKQFHPLHGKKLYRYPLDTMKALGVFDEILLVVPQDCQEDFGDEPLILGGISRQQSSFLGLQGFQQKPDIVLIHDAVRPFVTKEILLANLDGAILHGAVDTCIPTADTLVYAPNVKQIDKIPIRQHFLRGQTPQTFRYDWILRAHQLAFESGIENAYDDCQLVLNAGYPIQVVMGLEENFKVTTRFDLEVARILLQTSF